MKARIMNHVVEVPGERVGDGGEARPTPAKSGSRRDPASQTPSSWRGESAPPPSSVVQPSPRSAFRSKLEAAYSRYLHGLLLAGDIRQYRYEPLRFTLATKTTFTPDFQVILPDGTMEFHEVKGWARDDAMAKVKICARLYPEWSFRLVTRVRGVWDLRELPG